jgi:hypothetical protein
VLCLFLSWLVSFSLRFLIIERRMLSPVLTPSSKNCGNFGSFTCDWLFGTMDSYIVSGGVDAYVKSSSD